jgi:rhodanese-related sulfurtransferase
MKRALIALSLITAVVVLAGCGGGGGNTTATTSATSSAGLPGTRIEVDGGAYWLITPAQLAGMQRSSFLLVDVDETPAMVITSTEMYVSYDKINDNLDKFPADKDRPIVVYCIAGMTSQNAAEALVAAGYTRVMDLDGGTMAWQQQGYPVAAYTAS